MIKRLLASSFPGAKHLWPAVGVGGLAASVVIGSLASVATLPSASHLLSGTSSPVMGVGRLLQYIPGRGGSAFGTSVSVSGSLAAVGAPQQERNTGRAYVYAEKQGRWRESCELAAPPGSSQTGFGEDVAVSGDLVAVGAADEYEKGRVYLFKVTSGVCKMIFSSDGSGARNNDYFAGSLAISGHTLVVSAVDEGASDAGNVFVFQPVGSVWRQVAELSGSSGDMFGASVAVSGTTIALGAQDYDNGYGGVFVYGLRAGHWVQSAMLLSPSTFQPATFGIAVALSSRVLVVGAAFWDGGVGRSYIFDSSGSSWKLAGTFGYGVTKGYRTEDVANRQAFFGGAVATDGNSVVVGSPGFDVGGRGYLFTKSARGWGQAAQLSGSAAAFDVSCDVAVSGSSVWIGAPGHLRGWPLGSVGLSGVYVFSAS